MSLFCMALWPSNNTWKFTREEQRMDISDNKWSTIEPEAPYCHRVEEGHNAGCQEDLTDLISSALQPGLPHYSSTQLQKDVALFPSFSKVAESSFTI